MKTYYIHYEPDEMDELNRLSPFNLKKDLKDITREEIDKVAEEIANELYAGENRPPVVVQRFITVDRKVSWVKIRVDDVGRNYGKSKGYRCITIVDLLNKHAFLLHIYRHGHGEGENISKADENKLNEIVKQYADALNNGLE